MRSSSSARRSKAIRFKARLAAFARKNPRLYASRHVMVAAIEVLAGVLGVGAIFAFLIPNIDWSWIPWPSLDLSWLRNLWPNWLSLHWLWPGWLHLSLPDWLKPVLACLKWVVPIVVAIAVSFNEVGRRRLRKRSRQEQSQDE
ncbi:hypothetical protein ACHMW7_15620 [Aminobacter sp. UC22_36]|uniref:hypothetical protein n=1 Tax=Aminobacter sp. UC22_36 TaxID=3374549 RepID=UPI003757FAFE